MEDLHWISGQAPLHLLGDDGKYHLTMKIRHGPKLTTGSLLVLDNDNGNDEAVGETQNTGGIIQLDKKDGGLAPGQYVVFYTEDAECLGGGIISERHWNKFLLNAQVLSTKNETAVVK